MAERWFEGKTRNRSVRGKKRPVGANELAGEVRITDFYTGKSRKVAKNNLTKKERGK